MNSNKRLAEYLKDNGISQTYLANKTGISIKVINNIVNENRKMTADELGKISNVLKVSADIFLG